MATVATRRGGINFQSALTMGKHAYRQTRYFLQSMPYCLPRIVQCNVCSWSGRHFRSDAWHKHSVCPYCRSSIRHRLLCAALEQIPDLCWERMVHSRRVLHFAPERPLERALRARAHSYHSADCHNRRDLQLDISDMKSVADGAFDLLLACDVLEHVQDDRAAIAEIHRVLSPGGWAILTVPHQDDLDVTYEDDSIVDASERERAFGQRDHLRIYGADFTSRLAAVGFATRMVDETSFSPQLVQRHVLFPPQPSTHPLATNFRKVYFARK